MDDTGHDILYSDSGPVAWDVPEEGSELQHKLYVLLNEIDCRLQHGVIDRHLEYVQDQLDTILREHSEDVPSNATEPDYSVGPIDDVVAERLRQDGLWGVQDRSPLEWLSILAAEFGEVAEVVNEHHFGRRVDLDDYRTEMIQVAAVAIAAVENLDRRKSLAETRWRKLIGRSRSSESQRMVDLG